VASHCDRWRIHSILVLLALPFSSDNLGSVREKYCYCSCLFRFIWTAPCLLIVHVAAFQFYGCLAQALSGGCVVASLGRRALICCRFLSFFGFGLPTNRMNIVLKVQTKIGAMGTRMRAAAWRTASPGSCIRQKVAAISTRRLTIAWGAIAITYPFVFAILSLIVNPSYFFEPISDGGWELMFYALMLGWIQGAFVALAWILVNGVLLELIRPRLDISAFVFALVGGVLTAATIAIVFRLFIWSPSLRNADFTWGIFVAQGFLSGVIGTYCLHMASDIWAKDTSN